jgi:rubrerythrin
VLKLPRTPIKDTELRASAFEKRFGEGATELDALEALHPGLLRQMLVKEIQRYRNEDHDSEVERISDDIEDQLDEITEEVIEPHREKYNEIKAEFEEIARSYRAWCVAAKPFWQDITESLYENQPSFDDVDWVPDFDADEDPDPLFDSSRDYLEQIARYKSHQGKLTQRKRTEISLTCESCNKPFLALRSARFCSKHCNYLGRRKEGKRC